MTFERTTGNYVLFIYQCTVVTDYSVHAGLYLITVLDI
jgi:hypothetical protein